jgi:hypothetical protein
LPSVIDAVKTALNDAGIVFLQTPSPSPDGMLYLTTRLLHESGEWIQDTATTPFPKQDPQGYGSAITYLRRYSLSAITGLYQDDDDGNAAAKVATKPDVKPVERAACLSIDQITAIQDALTVSGLTAMQICTKAKVNSLAEIEAHRYTALLKWINEHKKEAENV